MPRKDGGLAVIIALAFPGLGHVYLERFIWAIVWFVVVLGAFMLIGPFALLLYFVSVWDAYRQTP